MAGALYPFATRDGRVLATVAADHRNLLTLIQWDGRQFTNLASSALIGADFAAEEVREAPDGSFWLVGGGTVWRWQLTQEMWTAYRGLPPPRLLDTLGRVWFADAQRVVRQNAAGFETVPGMRGPLWDDGAGDIWGLAEGGVVQVTLSNTVYHTEAVTGLRACAGGVVDARGRPWFYGRNPTGEIGLVRFDGPGWTRVPLPPSLESILALRADPEAGVWLLFGSPDVRQFHVGRVREDRLEIPPMVGERPLLNNPKLGVDRNGLWLMGYWGLLHASQRDLRYGAGPAG